MDSTVIKPAQYRAFEITTVTPRSAHATKVCARIYKYCWLFSLYGGHCCCDLCVGASRTACHREGKRRAIAQLKAARDADPPLDTQASGESDGEGFADSAAEESFASTLTSQLNSLASGDKELEDAIALDAARNKEAISNAGVECFGACSNPGIYWFGAVP